MEIFLTLRIVNTNTYRENDIGSQTCSSFFAQFR